MLHAAGLPICSVLAELLPRAAGVTVSRLLSASSVFRSTLSAGHEQTLAGQVACHHQAGGSLLSTCVLEPLDRFQGEQHDTACREEGLLGRTPTPAAQQAPGLDHTSVLDSQHLTGTVVSPSLIKKGMREANRAWSTPAERLYDPGIGSGLSGQQSRCKGTLVKPGIKNTTIAVGVSGGVDSAVAAMLLKDQG